MGRYRALDGAASLKQPNLADRAARSPDLPDTGCRQGLQAGVSFLLMDDGTWKSGLHDLHCREDRCCYGCDCPCHLGKDMSLPPRLRTFRLTSGGCRLEDDGGLSSDFTVIEAGDEPQALWIGVRPAYFGDGTVRRVVIQVCLQDRYMTSTLQGPVFITPDVWRELNAAVERRLSRRKPRRLRQMLSWVAWGAGYGAAFYAVWIGVTAVLGS